MVAVEQKIVFYYFLIELISSVKFLYFIFCQQADQNFELTQVEIEESLGGLWQFLQMGFRSTLQAMWFG